MDRVNNTQFDLHTRYPELLAPEDDRKNIVFVSPFLNKQGIYRMILPALELKETGRYNTLITCILPEDHTKTVDDYSIKIVPEIIRWADYMVFQANGMDMESLIMTIKGINPKCKVVMDMDRNYHTLNPNNYTSKRFTLDKVRNLEKNIRQVDITTYPDFATEDFYKKKVGGKLKTKILPNLLSPYQFEGIDAKKERPVEADKRFKVVVLGDQDDFDDLNSFRQTINDVMVRVPESKVYVLSNSLMYENKNPLRLINYTRVHYKDMTEYYSVLWNMNPDLAIIPVKKEAFHRIYYKILELGNFGIPMVSMNEYPYNHLLKKDLHILLSGQKKTLLANVVGMAENKEVRKAIADRCQKFIREKYTFLNPEMLDVYLDTFN